MKQPCRRAIFPATATRGVRVPWLPRQSLPAALTSSFFPRSCWRWRRQSKPHSHSQVGSSNTYTRLSFRYLLPRTDPPALSGCLPSLGETSLPSSPVPVPPGDSTSQLHLSHLCATLVLSQFNLRLLLDILTSSTETDAAVSLARSRSHWLVCAEPCISLLPRQTASFLPPFKEDRRRPWQTWSSYQRSEVSRC